MSSGAVSFVLPSNHAGQAGEHKRPLLKPLGWSRFQLLSGRFSRLDSIRAGNDVMLSAMVSSAAEDHEAEDQIGGGVGEEHERRGGHRARRLAADHSGR